MHDEGSLHIDKCTGCESSSGVCFDSRAKTRSSTKSDPILPVGIPRVPKYYAVRKGYSQGIFFLWSDCKRHVRGFLGCEFKNFRSYQEDLCYLE
jgi:hypothetical protein